MLSSSLVETVKAAKAKTGITDLSDVLESIHLSEVYNAGGVAKATPLAFSSTAFLPQANELVPFSFDSPLSHWAKRAQSAGP